MLCLVFGAALAAAATAMPLNVVPATEGDLARSAPALLQEGAEWAIPGNPYQSLDVVKPLPYMPFHDPAAQPPPRKCPLCYDPDRDSRNY